MNLAGNIIYLVLISCAASQFDAENFEVGAGRGRPRITCLTCYHAWTHSRKRNGMLHGKFDSVQYRNIPAGYLAVGIVLTIAVCAVDIFLKVRRLSKQGSNCTTLSKDAVLKQVIRTLHPSMLFWTIPGLLTLGVLRSWCDMGLYSGKSSALTTCCNWALLSVVVPLIATSSSEWLPKLRSWLKSFPLAHLPHFKKRNHEPNAVPNDGLKHEGRHFRPSRKHEFFRGVLAAAILTVIVLLADCSLELSWNDTFPQFGVSYFAIEVAIIGLTVLFTYFLCLRHAGGVALVVIACWVIGVAQYFVIKFKGVSIQPSDLLALSTAAEVGSAYVYSINRHVLSAASCALAAITLCSLLWKTVGPDLSIEKRQVPFFKSRSASYLYTATACLITLVCLVNLPSYQHDLGIEFGDWNTVVGVKTYGFLPSFIQTMQRTTIAKPKGYSAATAKKIEASYDKKYQETLGATSSRKTAQQQFSSEKPTVIAIMNESFSDLSIYDNIKSSGYEGPQFIKNGLTDALQKGALYVSVQGGGTCNSEFEFLTGYSLGLVGSTCPYVVYRLDNVGGLVKQFKSLGYSTTAIHPNLGSNWNRKSAYKELGFDKFLDIDSFAKDSHTLHAGITDATTYQRILEQLKSSDDPQFILDVTMQNHGGYTMGNTPADILTNYHVDGGDDASLNEYLSVINSSDNDLENFIQELKTVNRPVVLVFFGDHQPGISVTYNDAYYKNEDDLAHAARAYQTVYAIWANYDVAGNGQASSDVPLNTSTLGAQLMYQIGAPLSSYQKAQLACSSTIAQMNALGYQDGSGAWHKYDDAKGKEKKTISDLRKMFYLEFGSKF